MAENDPPASENRDPPARRRSSVAYDPARDTFTDLSDSTLAVPSAIQEESILQTQSEHLKQSARMNAMEEDGRKRTRVEAEDINEASRDKYSPQKRRRPSPGDEPRNAMTTNDKAEIRSVKDLPRVPKRVREDGEARDNNNNRGPSAFSRRPENGGPHERNGRRSRSPRNRRRSPGPYRRRSPPRKRDPSRSPSPIRTPPRDGPVIRPGGAKGKGRNVLAEQQRLAAEREQRQNQHVAPINRGVQDVSNQFYNQRPEWVKERGRDWRRNESQIKGLRSFNNWIKSCLIQKFSPVEKSTDEEEELGWGEQPKEPEEQKPLLVLDLGCGKGGDLNKWQLAPQPVGLYVGLDPANISIKQAQERYTEMRRKRRRLFDARFSVQDCFGEWIGNVPIIGEVGIDPNAGSGQISRFGGGGFDIVTLMFSMHYAFDTEERVRIMLRNVAGSLKKGGRFIGVVPNSDVLADQIREWYKQHPDKAQTLVETQPDKQLEKPVESVPTPPITSVTKDGEAEDDAPNWGNSIYRVRFPLTNTHGHLASDGSFRPPMGWKYTYWMAEAVDVPEFVVPWEAFRAIAEGFGLEQRYRKGFLDIWESETKGNDPVSREMSALGMRMGVTQADGGNLVMSAEEKEAVSFYHGFCFVKIIETIRVK